MTQELPQSSRTVTLAGHAVRRRLPLPLPWAWAGRAICAPARCAAAMLRPLRTGPAGGTAPSVGRDTGQLGVEGDLRAPPARGDGPWAAGGSAEAPLTASSGPRRCSPVHLCCSHLPCGHLAGQRKFKAAKYLGHDRALGGLCPNRLGRLSESATRRRAQGTEPACWEGVGQGGQGRSLAFVAHTAPPARHSAGV